MSSDQRRPTRGQRAQLQRLCRAHWALVATRPPTSAAAPRYELRERATPDGWARVVHVVAPAMVEQLTAAGWIERAGEDGREWWYRVTPSGIAAANGPLAGGDEQ